MSTLITTRNYEDGEILMQAELDLPLNQIEALFNTTQLTDENFENNSIDGGAKLLNGTVTTALFDTSAVTSATIEAEAVTGAKLAPDVAGAGLTQDGDGNLNVAVDDATISIDFDVLNVPDDGVVTAKLGAGSVTRAKLTEPNIEYSQQGGIDWYSGAAVTNDEQLNVWYDATNTAHITNGSDSTSDVHFPVTIETSGRPVLITVNMLGPATSSPSPAVQRVTNLVAQGPQEQFNFNVHYRITRNGTSIGGIQQVYDHTENNIPGIAPAFPIMTFIDTPSAGIHTYNFQMKVSANSGISEQFIRLRNHMRLIAVEL